ncbi:hypothetical protein LRP88_02181 [Fusarium phalaenopsidis]
MSDHKTSVQPHDGDHGDHVSDEKAQEAQCIENVTIRDGHIAPGEIQARFELLRHLSADQMETLNKSVRSKSDWHMMPWVTLMFLMK